MNMGTHKLMHKLEDFLGLSEKKQRKKREKLEGIIEKLQDKKNRLDEEIVAESEIDETSERYHDLDKQRIAISRLLKKAKQQASHLDEEA